MADAIDGTASAADDPRERPIGELVKDLSTQTSTLVRQEIELARAERLGGSYELYFPDPLVGREFDLSAEVLAALEDAAGDLARLDATAAVLTNSEALQAGTNGETAKDFVEPAQYYYGYRRRYYERSHPPRQLDLPGF